MRPRITGDFGEQGRKVLGECANKRAGSGIRSSKEGGWVGGAQEAASCARRLRSLFVCKPSPTNCAYHNSAELSDSLARAAAQARKRLTPLDSSAHSLHTTKARRQAG